MKLTSNGGYHSVNVKIYVPDSVKNAVFTPASFIFMPPKGQRLAISPNYDEEYYRDYRNQKLIELLKNPRINIVLTEAEAKLIFKHPYSAFKMLLTSRIAKDLTRQRYPGDPAQDNEADAFRHFIWSAYSAKEVGLKMAKKFLDAHEETSDRTRFSIEMDYHNNSLGLAVGDRLKESENFKEEIVKEFELLLRNKRFKIIK